MSALPDWIAAESLRPAWTAIRRRYEAEGLRPHGKVTVATSTRAERHALGELLGRTIAAERFTVDLGDLDRRLQDRSGVGGLGQVLSRLFGEEPEDRPAARAARLAAREAPLRLAAELVQTPWADAWIAAMRKVGLLTGRPDASEVIEQAAAVLLLVVGGAASHDQPSDLNSTPWPERPGPDAGPPSTVSDPGPAGRHWRAGRERGASRPGGVEPPSGVIGTTWSRVELGARVVGDAHALDLDRLLHRVVLRGLAAAAGEPLPEGARAREELWARFGVAPDLLSRTCLVWTLAPRGPSAVSQRLTLAAEAGDPVHLTAWDLRQLDDEAFQGTQQRVLVCENPRVIEAIAEAGPPGWSAVCTAGEPNLVVASVLGSLARTAAQLHYHGDFDWPGIAIANRILARFGAQTLQMSADDYLIGVRPSAPPLSGLPVEPSWDSELGAAMRHHERVVHEESVLTRLLAAMQGGH